MKARVRPVSSQKVVHLEFDPALRDQSEQGFVNHRNTPSSSQQLSKKEQRRLQQTRASYYAGKHISIAKTSFGFIALGIIIHDACGFYGTQAMPLVIPEKQWDAISQLKHSVLSVNVPSGEIRAVSEVVSEGNMFERIMNAILDDNVELTPQVPSTDWESAAADAAYAQLDFVYDNELWSIRRSLGPVSIIRQTANGVEEMQALPPLDMDSRLQTFRPANGREGFIKSSTLYNDAFGVQHQIVGIDNLYSYQFRLEQEKQEGQGN